MKRSHVAVGAMAMCAAFLLTACAPQPPEEVETYSDDSTYSDEVEVKVTDPRDGWILIGEDQVLENQYRYPYVRAICVGSDLMLVATDYDTSGTPTQPVFQINSPLCGPE